MPKYTLVAALLSSMAATAMASPPPRLPVLGTKDAAPTTTILVLGTAHLSRAPKGFTVASLDPVMTRLAAFRPDIITVEQLSGETCDLMARHPTVYDPADVRQYCHDTSDARKATGRDVPEAIADVRKTLKQWPAAPKPAERRRLTALFLASGDDTSAAVQWLQLPESERMPGDGMDQTLVDAMNKRITSNTNESVIIAARLAAKLGLQRVYPIDDHTGDNLEIDDADAYGKAVSAAWATAEKERKPMNDAQDKLLAEGQMLALYRSLNQPENMARQSRTDFGAALTDRSPQHYGQLYVAGWEIRNMRMAANIHATFGATPGLRVLSIVGATHKPWLDGLLGQMQGVEIVDAGQVLR